MTPTNHSIVFAMALSYMEQGYPQSAARMARKAAEIAQRDGASGDIVDNYGRDARRWSMMVVCPASVRVMASIDGVMQACPSHVIGAASAQEWLEARHPHAQGATFYEAEREADHPCLISGGIYLATRVLIAFERRDAA
ncbi:MAG: hypothetical protein AAGE80_05475 [Pseudomonadota bacterium]